MEEEQLWETVDQALTVDQVALLVLALRGALVAAPDHLVAKVEAEDLLAEEVEDDNF